MWWKVRYRPRSEGKEKVIQKIEEKKDARSKGGKKHDKEKRTTITWVKIDKEPLAWTDVLSDTICEFWMHQAIFKERQFFVQHQQISPVSSCD